MSDVEKIGADRAGLMERYQEAMGIPVEPTDAEAPEAAKAGSDSANNTVPKTEVQPEAGHTDAAPKEPVAKEVVKSDPGVTKEVEKEGEPKLVPLSALHEAREKIKAKTLEARTFKEQLSAKDQELSDVRNRLNALEDEIRKAKGEILEPQDEATMKLVEENKKLKADQAKTLQEQRIKSQEDAAKETARLITVADDTLTKEGFPGFKRFGRDVYDAIVAKINSGEIEEKDVTTDMWAKVYKEEVYPQVKAVFVAQTKKEADDAKKKRKESANLVRNPGEGPMPKEEENLDAPQTAESYLKVRKTLH